MKDIKLTELLEAGCHFGHKAEKWHPKASEYIYGERDGVHIIDLAKTRSRLLKAAQYMENLGKEGKVVLVVATKRQAKGVVTDAAKKAKLPYMTNRWIGGLLTNWGEVKKNIDKMNTYRKEKADGSWSKFPKHEQVGHAKILRKLEMVYQGVADLTAIPDAVFIVDVKREIISYTESTIKHLPVIGMVDTNTDPRGVNYSIPANDDAVGSIQIITEFLMDAYIEGAKLAQKGAKTDKTVQKEEKEIPLQQTDKKSEVKEKLSKIKKDETKQDKPAKAKKPEKNVKADKSETKKEIVKEETEPVKKKRGRPKKDKK
jgi:small subunit ribosomal protein S2